MGLDLWIDRFTVRNQSTNYLTGVYYCEIVRSSPQTDPFLSMCLRLLSTHEKAPRTCRVLKFGPFPT